MGHRIIGIISEMGVDLKNQAPESYLGKTSKKTTDLKANKTVFDEIMNDLKNIRWQDLGIKKVVDDYYITLPEAIIQKIRSFRSLNSTLGAKLGRWNQLDGTGIHMRRDDHNFNRSHFPDGGLNDLAGIGLGYKCYRRFLEYSKYLSSNTNGTLAKDNAWASLIKKRPDPDDVHAIVGPSNVLAIIKTISSPEKINVARKFIDELILPNIQNITDNNFAIDDELKAILPEAVLAPLDPTKREETKRRAVDAERVNVQRAAETQLERSRALFDQFGIDQIDHTWRIGDFVIRYEVLYDLEAKPRIVAQVDNQLRAISIDDYIMWAAGASHAYLPRISRELNTSWTKIDINDIPDTDNVRLSPTEKAFLDKVIEMGRTTVPAIGTDEARVLSVQASRPVNTQRPNVNYGPAITGYDTTEYNTIILNRPIRQETARKLQQSDFIKKVYLNPNQFTRYQNGQSSEVFAAFNGNTAQMLRATDNPQKAINTLTGFVIDYPNEAGMTAKFELIVPRTKHDLRPGDMIYIANHPSYYGLTGKVGYSVLNDAQQAFVAIQIFNPALSGDRGRKVSINLSFIRKMRVTI